MKKSGKGKRITKEQAIDRLWRASNLSWKLKGSQIDIYNYFKNSDKDINAVLCSRRLGKTFTMCVIAVETCLETPKAVVKYVCPTSKMVVNVMQPTVRDIIEDCPDDLKPHWYPSEKKWKFPNGSEIQVAGTEGQSYNAIRGGYSNLGICDEAAFSSELETVVYNVLAPTTDTTGGKILLASTPNDRDPNHEFHELFIHPLEASGELLKLTWLDSPMIDDKQRERILKRYPGGMDNIKFRCEYLCEIPNITEASIVPEFTKMEESIVKDIEVPDYCDFYTALDVGFKDLSVGLFGYYDTTKSILVITDELVMNGPEMTTDKLHKEIMLKEEINFIDGRGVVQESHMRIMDNDLKLINDLSRFYGMLFMPTEKHNKEQAVDTVRRWVEAGRIVISPKCKNLIYHTKYAQWHLTKQGTFTGKFKHLKGNESSGLLRSHADALDALIYLVRNIQTYHNPYPDSYGQLKGSGVFNSPNKQSDSALQSIMNTIMGKKPK